MGSNSIAEDEQAFPGESQVHIRAEREEGKKRRWISDEVRLRFDSCTQEDGCEKSDWEHRTNDDHDDSKGRRVTQDKRLLFIVVQSWLPRVDKEKAEQSPSDERCDRVFHGEAFAP